MKKLELVKGKITTVTILKETVERLKEIGRKSETYDAIINRLIRENNESQQIKVNK